MTAQSIVCGTCAADVPYGRLSCPSCGELLASVARGRKGVAGSARRRAASDARSDRDAAPATARGDGPVTPATPARDLDSELPWAAAIDDGVDDTDDEADEHGPTASIRRQDDATAAAPLWAVGGVGLTGSPTPRYMPRPPRPSERPSSAPMAPDTAEPGLDAMPEPPVAPAAPPPTAAAAPPPAASASAAATPAAPPFAGPGAYVPPPPAPAIPAGPPAPAREWAGHGPEPDGRSGPAARSGSAASKDPSDARARLAEFVRWLSVAGASFASVGFLLPWGLVLIGSNGVGYFDRWGLAGPGHVIVVVGLLAVLALGLIANGIPIWIRTGLAGLGLGTLVLGLIWPYLLGPLGSGPGAVIVGVGAVALAISGLLALVTDRGDRHAEVDRSV